MFGDLCFANEKTCVCAGYVAYSMKQLSQFVCKAVLPHLSEFVQFDEMPIFKHITCCVVNDCANEVFRCVHSRVWLLGVENVCCKSIALLAIWHSRGWQWHLGICEDVVRDDTVNHVCSTFVEASTHGGW